MSAWPPRDDPDNGPLKRASLREMQQMSRSEPATVTRTASGETLLTNAGYGFGLRVRQSCGVRHIVAHGGGLPGFGTLMQWYPEHGVGLIAMGSMTYAGWGPAFTLATDALAATGAFLPRDPQPSPALVEARQKSERPHSALGRCRRGSRSPPTIYISTSPKTGDARRSTRSARRSAPAVSTTGLTSRTRCGGDGRWHASAAGCRWRLRLRRPCRRKSRPGPPARRSRRRRRAVDRVRGVRGVRRVRRVRRVEELEGATVCQGLRSFSCSSDWRRRRSPPVNFRLVTSTPRRFSPMLDGRSGRTNCDA